MIKQFFSLTTLFVGSLVMAHTHIEQFKWGEIKVRDANGMHTYRDAKVFSTGSKSWDWNETGTRHNPGIQIADVQELMNHDIIILSRGVDLVLQTKQETIDYLKQHSKEHYILQSEEAAKLYNQLAAQGKNVAILLHSTC